LNYAVWGKNDQSFLKELVVNAAMFGVLKMAAAGAGVIFKVTEESGLAWKTTAFLGQKGTSLAALHLFSEAHHLIENGKLMTGEERYRAILQNALMFAGLELGHFLTRPLTQVMKERLGPRFEGKLKAEIEKIDAQLADEQAALAELVKAADAGKPVDSKEYAKRLEDLWNKRAKALDQLKLAELPPDVVKEALAAHAEQAARMELVLAEMGVDAPVAAERAFRPIAPGFVVFADGQRAAIEQLYKDKGRPPPKLDPETGMLIGELEPGQRTVYLPEAGLPKAGPAS
jgi:hypothetical protein